VRHFPLFSFKEFSSITDLSKLPIEIIQAAKITEIIADTNFIHAIYRIAGFNVKHCSRKMRFLVNKKGKLTASDLFFLVGISK
jgi:hypothetical protein